MIRGAAEDNGTADVIAVDEIKEFVEFVEDTGIGFEGLTVVVDTDVVDVTTGGALLLVVPFDDDVDDVDDDFVCFLGEFCVEKNKKSTMLEHTSRYSSC